MVDKVQEIAMHKKDQEVEVIRQHMRDVAKEFEEYNDVVKQEVKVNEMIRYKQRKIIHKLKEDVLELKKIMAVPRLYSKYVEESKVYHKKKSEGEYLSKRDHDLYDLASDRSTPFCNQHRSICKNLNDKSRISLPIVQASEVELNESDNEQDITLNQKYDYVPGQLFNPKSSFERHNELVKELKGSRNKPSILGQYKTTALDQRKASFSQLGNLTERKTNIKLSSLDRKLNASTDFSEGTNKVSARELPVNIFDKQLDFPKTFKQKELFGKMRHNQSLPQLARNMNRDIRHVTKQSHQY